MVESRFAKIVSAFFFFYSSFTRRNRATDPLSPTILYLVLSRTSERHGYAFCLFYLAILKWNLNNFCDSFATCRLFVCFFQLRFVYIFLYDSFFTRFCSEFQVPWNRTRGGRRKKKGGGKVKRFDRASHWRTAGLSRAAAGRRIKNIVVDRLVGDAIMEFAGKQYR